MQMCPHCRVSLLAPANDGVCPACKEPLASDATAKPAEPFKANAPPPPPTKVEPITFSAEDPRDAAVEILEQLK